MSNTILKRCIDELAKEKPDISYVRGMLETLAELNAPPLFQVRKDSKIVPVASIPATGPATLGEGQLLDAMAMANLEKVRNIAAKSLES